MQTLLTAIATWLSINFGLPADVGYPHVEFISPAKMQEVRFQGSGPAVIGGQAVRETGGQDTEALYIDATRTIYLRKGWKGTTPAEVSVLVHEMAHHMQNVSGLKYECPQAREELAYTAQDRWLAKSGLNLKKAFKLDPMTLLVRTKCMY